MNELEPDQENKKEEKDEVEGNSVENPFISNEQIEKEIGGGMFKFRELTGEEHDTMQSRLYEVEEGELVGYDIAAKHQYMLVHAVVDVPESFELNGTHYKELGVEDKKKLWNKVKPGLREKVLEAANDVNGFSEEEVKK